MSPGVMDQVKADLVKLGFQHGNVAVEGKTSLFIKKLFAHPSNC